MAARWTMTGWPSASGEDCGSGTRNCARVVKLAARNPAHDLVLDGAASTLSSQLAHACRRPKSNLLGRCLGGIESLTWATYVDAGPGLGLVRLRQAPAHPDPRPGLHTARARDGQHSVRRPVSERARSHPVGSGAVRLAAGAETAAWPKVAAAMALVRHGIPIVVCPGLAAGATLRDGVVAANAGFLASLVLYQCARPGAPLIYGIEDLTGFRTCQV